LPSHGGWRQLSTAFLIAVAVLFGAVGAAHADAYVAFSDPILRTAVASQLVKQGQLPPGSDGTTITTSDIETLTVLSASGQGIARLGGLQSAVNLTSLVLARNKIADITELSGLTRLTELDLSGNYLDVGPGTPAMSIIATLEGLGAHVSYGSQHAQLSKLAVSSSASTYGKSATFSAVIAPPGAALSGASKVRLCHLETKTVTKLVNGKKKKVAVNYWRLRRTLTMQGSSAGHLSAKTRLPYAGVWRVQVTYGGSADYESCKSTLKTFVVRDPRIDAAIAWGRRGLGSHTWDHYCLRFVSDCYASGAHASVHRYQTAKEAARALHAAAHRSANAPRGAWVFYDSTALGHVGISLGNGTMINDYGGAGVKIMRIKSAGHYVGWAAPPLSPPISDWNQPTKS
jgi:hypothetical protein